MQCIVHSDASNAVATSQTMPRLRAGIVACAIIGADNTCFRPESLVKRFSMQINALSGGIAFSGAGAAPKHLPTWTAPEFQLPELMVECQSNFVPSGTFKDDPRPTPQP